MQKEDGQIGEKRLGSNLLHNMGQPEGSYEVESVRCFLLSVSPGFLGIGSLAFSLVLAWY